MYLFFEFFIGVKSSVFKKFLKFPNTTFLKLFYSQSPYTFAIVIHAIVFSNRQISSLELLSCFSHVTEKSDSKLAQLS